MHLDMYEFNEYTINIKGSIKRKYKRRVITLEGAYFPRQIE